MNSYDLSLWIYNLALVPIVFFSILFMLLTFMNFLEKKEKKPYRKLAEVPFVTVQIPTYNDPVSERCVKKCLEFDYPKDKYEIIIADDSTNQETRQKLGAFAKKYPRLVKYTHRDSRDNFKPGALNNALKYTKGEIIVLFDADWIPGRCFLKKIIAPFADEKVAIVQSRQGFYNQNTNIVTRFASYLLMVHHTIVLPLSNRINCVFFCGTAGAVRKSALLKVGGWNVNSITEDSDLTVNLLVQGYKSVYLDFETPSEVPNTIEGFIKQQMRWCYGNMRVFIENASRIFGKRGLSLKQRLMILYITLGNLIAPIVVVMTFFGFAGWFLGDLKMFTFKDFANLLFTFTLTSGFLLMGLFVLYKRKQLKSFPYLIASTMSIGIVLSAANTVAIVRAMLNKKLGWFCTPKVANDKFVSDS